MTRNEIDEIPEYVAAGILTWDTAVQELSVYILKNKSLFGLQKYDEDFCSEIIVSFLDRGKKTLKLYKRENGNFFVYFYCFVKCIFTSRIKQNAILNILEFHNVQESINTYYSEVEAYSRINYDDFEKPKIPYNYNQISFQDFQIACKTDKYHFKPLLKNNKKIREILQQYPPKLLYNIFLVLGLRAAYYITDSQINNICTMFEINKEKFYQMIQQIKQEIENREKNKTIIEERRNRAYFQHKKLKCEILYKSQNDDNFEYKAESLNQKYEKNTRNWNKLNQQLEDGKILIRPTSRFIGEVMGISERQVTYYLTTARQLGLSLDDI